MTGVGGNRGPIGPEEVNEADWEEGHLAREGVDEDGSVASDRPLGDRLFEAGEGDLLESDSKGGSSMRVVRVPLEAPEADVLEQSMPPSDVDVDEEDWR